MRNSMKRIFLTLSFIVAAVFTLAAQASKAPASQANYIQVITKRADKIVQGLGLTDSAKYKRVRDVIVNQYNILSNIHDSRDAKVKDIKAQAGDDKAKANTRVATVDSAVEIQLSQAHTIYIAKLGTELNAEQIDEVKDLMTYKILPLTYNAYLDELPTLTNAQKAQIKAWLIEAREHAIDAGSSEKKHEWFGKYKGRINNYLSKQGYDMKKAGIEWQKRIKERQSQNG